MKTGYEREQNRLKLTIELSRAYEENYKIIMLKENRIPGILPVSGSENGEKKSRYSYSVSGMMTMKTRFGKIPLDVKEMTGFIRNLLEAVRNLKRYMLTPDGLVLYPECIFWNKERWMFCYLPVKRRPWQESLRTLIEFFIQKLEKEDVESILFAYELQKSVLQEHCDLEKILREYEARNVREKKEKEQEESYVMEEHMFMLDDTESQNYTPQTVRETSPYKKPRQKAMGKIKKSRWGNWKEMLFETDGQGEKE